MMLNTEIKKKKSIKKKNRKKNTQHCPIESISTQSWHAIIFYFHHQNFVDILNEEQNEEIQKWNRT